MSARSYQIKLREALDKLSIATRTAQEWKSVAENRLTLLYAVDLHVHLQVADLLKIGTIFGVDPADPGFPLAKDSRMSGDETTGVITEKLAAVSSFTANLTREAADLQMTLDDTLSLAIAATRVEPPLNDTMVADHTSAVRTATRPLKEVYSQIEDLESDEDGESGESSSPGSVPGNAVGTELVLRTMDIFS